jgi:hypothetical protein
MVCALDHILAARATFCDDQHKNSSGKEKGPRHDFRVGGPSLSCHQKGSTIPGRTWNYVEELSCRVWSITDKATTEVALSRERPFGYPTAFPLLWSELLRISLPRIAWLPH